MNQVDCSDVFNFTLITNAYMLLPWLAKIIKCDFRIAVLLLLFAILFFGTTRCFKIGKFFNQKLKKFLIKN